MSKSSSEEQRARIEAAQHGSGRYIYQNNTKGDYMLPRPTATGLRRIGAKMQFEGDSYYLQFVRSHDLRLIKVIETPLQEQTMNEKLLTEQPPTVTTEGTVEFVKSEKKIKLNENEPSKNAETEVLLNESPMAGIELI